MIRIIDGVAYEGKGADFFNVKAHDLGNGHLEITGSRGLQWRELDWSPSVIRDHLEMIAQYREEHAEELRERHAEQAAKRAKKRVRHLCKAMGADTMLTLTYRENVRDLDLCKAHLKEFNRRMLRILPGFRFVAAFEQQERGAWHVHMACERIPSSLPLRGAAALHGYLQPKVKSYNAIRAVWRSVTKELGGNIDVANTKRNSGKTPARIAQYIAGYIIKGFREGALHSNRWTKYGAFDVPKPQPLGQVRSMLELVEVAYSLTGDMQIAMDRLDRWKDWFVIHAEARSKRPLGALGS